MLSNGSRTIYGIHVGGTGTSTSLNFATRITQTMFSTFQSWTSQDPLPTGQGPAGRIGSPGRRDPGS